VSAYDNIMNVLDDVTKERDDLKKKVTELEKKLYGIKRFLFALLDSPGVPERANKAISKAIHDLARTSEEA
jgi:hypothetical protein